MGGKTISDDEDQIEEQEVGEALDVERDADRDDDEEEDEEEGQDGFIVNDNKDEEEDKRDDNEQGRRWRKKKNKRETESFVLDEDDYELLQDANITCFCRPLPDNKFKRLKKAGRDTEVEGRSGFPDEESSDRNSCGKRTAEEKLKYRLSGDAEGPQLEDHVEDEEEDVDIGEDDGIADIIVDEDEIDENGVAVKKKKANRKKIRQTLGVSSSAIQEAYEIFGDVEELLLHRKQTIAGVSNNADDNGVRRLEDEFEPLILHEKYMTQEDDLIRETDVAERIQLSENITGPPPTDAEKLVEESEWIYNQLLAAASDFIHDKLLAPACISPQVADLRVVREKAIDKDDIARFLEMIHVQKLDIPFIATYRKELCISLLKDTDDLSECVEKPPGIKWHMLLWTVYNLDRKWLFLQKRKSALQMYYKKWFTEESRRINDETPHALNRKKIDSINEALIKATTEREVDDIHAKINLHFPPGEVEIDKGQYKRPKHKSFYSTCHKAGLWKVADKFGYSSEQFGLYLTMEEFNLLELKDAKEIPEKVASDFTCVLFKTSEDVLKGARYMAAAEISCEPIVKKHVRNTFMRNATVSTVPTAEGNSTIDAYHELAGMKWLRDKPLSKFVDAQWLRIQKAEEEKLLNVNIKLPMSIYDGLLMEARENYLSECVSKSAKSWNSQRAEIVEMSFSQFLLPAMEKEARALLTFRAKSWLVTEYGKKLWNKVSVGPRKIKNQYVYLEDDRELRVMACCWGPGQPATTFVMLDSAGEVVDVLYTSSFGVRSQGVTEKQRKSLDQQQLLKFMTDHKPHMMCLGAANLACRPLKDDIYEVIFRIVEDLPRYIGQYMNISIVFEDESLPRLYENSRISTDQLPAQPGIVKRAVGLGRYLQNPLAMIATLCGPRKEILSWKLCPLENLLTDDEKYEMIEQIMIDATNQVGLDVNLAASHEWLFAPLQFVSGLGPRKASALKRGLVINGPIFSRKEMLNKYVRRKVFFNSIGFLRVRRSGAAASSSHIMDLLDDTRIHPESYALAKKMAEDCYAEDFESDMDEEDQGMAIEHVTNNPLILKCLCIDAYHEDYVRRLGIRKWETLYFIKFELLPGFQDWRVPFTEPSPEEEFYMLSGETEESLFEEKLVQVTVHQVFENRIICSFDSGLKGLIGEHEFSDTGFDPEKVQVGDVLMCKIRNVNRQRYIVYLTCRSSDLSRNPCHIRNIDPYYQPEEVNEFDEQEKAKKEKELAKKNFKPRLIVHPRFQNLTADEAMQFLSNKEAGESIIHPSSKGPKFLTLTIKIHDEVYANKDIVESGIDSKDVTSLLRISKTLQIDDEMFEDLDEVMDRYVDPLVAHLKTMLGYRRFRRGNKGELDHLLRAEKAENPARIVYCFRVSYEYPGSLMLSYIRNANPHHEYIGLYPKGFKFRKLFFEDIDLLVSYFQKNINKVPPRVEPSLRTGAAMVPMKSPAAGAWCPERGTSTLNSQSGEYMDLVAAMEMRRKAFEERKALKGAKQTNKTCHIETESVDISPPAEPLFAPASEVLGLPVLSEPQKEKARAFEIGGSSVTKKMVSSLLEHDHEIERLEQDAFEARRDADQAKKRADSLDLSLTMVRDDLATARASFNEAKAAWGGRISELERTVKDKDEKVESLEKEMDGFLTAKERAVEGLESRMKTAHGDAEKGKKDLLETMFFEVWKENPGLSLNFLGKGKEVVLRRCEEMRREEGDTDSI